MPTSQPLAPAARLARLIAMLCEQTAARLAVPSMHRPGLAGPLIILIWTRLTRLAARMDRLAVQVAAGTLQPPRRRPPCAPRRPPPERPRLPRGFAWLVRQVPAAAVGAGQLQSLLSDPEMAALIAAAPQLGRSLRPLCHMLGLRPPPILRPPAPVPPPAAAAPTPRPPAAPARSRRWAAPPATGEARAHPSAPPPQPGPAPEVAARHPLRPAPA